MSYSFLCHLPCCSFSAGRPGGPAFYISTVDNVQNHGPASQGSGTEADSCFGKIYPQSIPVILPFLTVLCGASFLVSIQIGDEQRQ